MEAFLDRYSDLKYIHDIELGSNEQVNKQECIERLFKFFKEELIDENMIRDIFKQSSGVIKRDFKLEEIKEMPKRLYDYYNHILGGVAKSKRKKPKTERNKRKKRKTRKKKKKSQSGGFCAPCLMGPLFTAAGLGTTGYMMSSSSSSSNINGKKSVKRNEKYQITKNGKTHKRSFKQKDKRVYDGKKISEYDNIKEATEAYNSLIKKCKAKGFQKC